LAKRQAWTRSSVGANKKMSIGKSYSVLSMDREKLKALPVLSKKRSMLRSKPNVMEVAPEVEEEVKSYTEEDFSVFFDKFGGFVQECHGLIKMSVRGFGYPISGNLCHPWVAPIFLSLESFPNIPCIE